MASENTQTRKIMALTLGDKGVGKTAVAARYAAKPIEYGTEGDFYDFSSSGNDIFEFRFWHNLNYKKPADLAMLTNTLSHMAAIILVYDVTSKASFNNIKNWLDNLSFNVSSSSIYLLGNKIDLAQQRQVTHEEARTFATKHNLKYFETSARDNIGFDEARHALISDLVSPKKPAQNKTAKNIGQTFFSKLNKFFKKDRDDENKPQRSNSKK